MKRFMIGCVAIACVVTGCGSSKDAGPTSVTSTMGTPSAGTRSGVETPLGSATTTVSPLQSTQVSASAASAQGFSEASRVFAAFEEAVNRAQAEGGAAVLPPAFRDLVAPPVSVDTQQQLAKQRLDDWRLGEPLPTVRNVVNLAEQQQGSTVALQACVDGTHSPVVLHGKNVGSAEAYSYRAFFKPVDGHLKLFMLQHKQVGGCG